MFFFFKQPYVFQAVNRVAGKTADGLRNDHIKGTSKNPL